MISEELNAEMNKQIVEELQSGYIYMGMGAWAEEQGLHNLANFMQIHAETEEFKHAMKFVKFIQEAGGKVEYGALEEITTAYKDVEELLNKAIAHEQHISARIRVLQEVADKNNDVYAQELLMWFHEEQMEEENLFEELMNLYELNNGRLGLFDHRVHHPE